MRTKIAAAASITMKNCYVVLTREQKLEAAARAVTEAYASRFEGNGPRKMFGPIDNEIIALMDALK